MVDHLYQTTIKIVKEVTKEDVIELFSRSNSSAEKFNRLGFDLADSLRVSDNSFAKMACGVFDRESGRHKGELFLEAARYAILIDPERYAPLIAEIFNQNRFTNLAFWVQRYWTFKDIDAFEYPIRKIKPSDVGDYSAGIQEGIFDDYLTLQITNERWLTHIRKRKSFFREAFIEGCLENMVDETSLKVTSWQDLEGLVGDWDNIKEFCIQNKDSIGGIKDSLNYLSGEAGDNWEELWEETELLISEIMNSHPKLNMDFWIDFYKQFDR